LDGAGHVAIFPLSAFAARRRNELPAGILITCCRGKLLA
jgi:hypothetical protein